RWTVCLWSYNVR
ncbi:msha biogenesis mshi domain protein, partial [Vibrio parahaemolyticus V-223/04]